MAGAEDTGSGAGMGGAADDRLHRHFKLLAAAGRFALLRSSVRAASHQLAQPLAAIANYAAAATELRRLGRLDEARLDELLENISRLVARAGDILAEVKDIGERYTTTTRIEVNQVVREVLAVMGRRLREQGVRVRAHFAEGLDDVLGDPIALEQAVIQVLINALDALHEASDGPPVLDVCTAQEGRGRVRIDVLDNANVTSEETAAGRGPLLDGEAGAPGPGLFVLRDLVEDLNGRLQMQREHAHTRCSILLPSVPRKAS